MNAKLKDTSGLKFTLTAIVILMSMLAFSIYYKAVAYERIKLESKSREEVINNILLLEGISTPVNHSPKVLPAN